jgi:hypothetical protein
VLGPPKKLCVNEDLTSDDEVQDTVPTWHQSQLKTFYMVYVDKKRWAIMLNVIHLASSQIVDCEVINKFTSLFVTLPCFVIKHTNVTIKIKLLTVF